MSPFWPIDISRSKNAAKKGATRHKSRYKGGGVEAVIRLFIVGKNQNWQA